MREVFDDFEGLTFLKSFSLYSYCESYFEIECNVRDSDPDRCMWKASSWAMTGLDEWVSLAWDHYREKHL